MKREEQELLERAEGNESRDEQQENIEVGRQEDASGLEDEFDREFWIKVHVVKPF